MSVGENHSFACEAIQMQHLPGALRIVTQPSHRSTLSGSRRFQKKTFENHEKRVPVSLAPPFRFRNCIAFMPRTKLSPTNQPTLPGL